MANSFSAIEYPELVFGIAGAIGIDIEEINRTLSTALASVSYKAVPIRITVEIEDEITNVPKPVGNDFGSQMSYKMTHASEVCRKYKSPDALMRFAIRAIRYHRAANSSTAIVENEIDGDAQRELPAAGEAVIPRTAYIIRQLKRPEEVELLRKVYGKQFVLITAYGTAESRKR